MQTKDNKKQHPGSRSFLTPDFLLPLMLHFNPMKPHKEHYRRKLPHFQQPGQWYSVTFTLAGAIPKGTMERYSSQLYIARTQLKELRSRESEFPNSDKELTQAQNDYRIALLKYRLAYDRILNKSAVPGLILAKEENRKIIENTLLFWEGKRLTNHAWCIMSNHVHWVITVFERDEKGKPVFLQDVLHSVKLFTARGINENENLHGQFWEHESFETTIRDDGHFARIFRYVIQNPVKAGLVQNWQEWPGTRTFPSP
jgi:putative transposase